MAHQNPFLVSFLRACFVCIFGLTLFRIAENDGYPFLCSTMSEFNVFCVVNCPFYILNLYIYDLKIETFLTLTLHVV